MLNVNFLGGLGIIRAQIKREFAYRFNFIIWSMVIPSWIIMDYFLWKAVYSFAGQELIRGMTFEALISYYIAALMVGILADAGFDDWVADKIRTGKLIKFINYPMSFIHFMFFRWAASRLLNFPIFVPPLIILGYFLVGFNIFASNLSLVAITILLACIINFTFVLMFALLAFWFKDIKGLRHLRQGITWFMSGSIIPINFFPIWFQKVSYYLPFQYMRYIPAQIMIGSSSISASMILVQFIWIIVLLSMATVFWYKAYRQFTGVGV